MTTDTIKALAERLDVSDMQRFPPLSRADELLIVYALRRLTSERGEAVQQEAVRKLVFRIRERSINRLHNREFQMTLNDCVRELAAPVWPRIADGGQWRTIESAPKDGQDVLLYFPLEGLSDSFEKTIIAHWRKKVNDAGEYWVWQGRSYRGYSIEYQPTHWMPLPLPPQPEHEAGQEKAR